MMMPKAVYPHGFTQWDREGKGGTHEAHGTPIMGVDGEEVNWIGADAGGGLAIQLGDMANVLTDILHEMKKMNLHLQSITNERFDLDTEED